MIFKNLRPTIGIPFNYDEGWIGGAYYIKNLIGCLGLLPDSERPEIWLLSHEEKSFDFIRESTDYSRLNWVKPAMLADTDAGPSRRSRLLSIVTPRFLKKNPRFDLIYPYPIDQRWQQTACWIPDFQDKHLPEFFSQEELVAREAQHRGYFQNYKHIVFSSHAAKQDFEMFYPEVSVNTHVVHFAVYESEAVKGSKNLKIKYDMPERYFYCPNQFWIHKNHDIVIDAVAMLKDQGVEATVVFSGKEFDYRAPEYTRRLKERVIRGGLEENFRFLGFIPRSDQMVIFRDAICVIQPSLFEGWSTVIEDAKSVSQHVLASNIPANLEQEDENIKYFDPRNANELARIMAGYMHENPVRHEGDYKQHQLAFARSFLDMLMAVVKANKSNG